MLNRPWYTHQVNRPWKEDGKIRVVVRAGSMTRHEEAQDYFTSDVVDSAVLKIFDFYGRQVAVTAAQIIKEDIKIPERPAKQPTLLIAVSETVVADAPWKVDAAAGIMLSRSYATKDFLKRVEEIQPTFTSYQKKYRFFQGSISPGINFVQEHNRLTIAVQKIKDYIEFNKVPYRTNEDDEIVLHFDGAYRILQISLIHRGREKVLTRGAIYYLQDSRGLKDIRTNQLLFNLANIYNERKNPPPWTQFINNYMPGVTIDYFGRPRTPECSNTLLEHQDKNNPVVMTLEDMAYEAEYLAAPENQECLIDEAATEKVDNTEDIKKIAADMQKFKEKAEMVQAFIDKYGINHLIEAALECLAAGTGISRGDMPRNLAGVNPFAGRKPPTKLTLPRLDIPLPSVSIGGDISAEIKKALMDALMGALHGTIEAIADIIVDLCHQQDEEDIGRGLPLNALIDDFANPTEENKEGGVQGGLAQCYGDYGIPPGIGHLFLGLVAANITPQETCNLINEAPSPSVIEIIYNLMEFNPVLEPIRGAFEDEDDLVSFFVCVGNLMSPDYCASLGPPAISELDPCTIEELLAGAVDDQLFDDLINAYNDPEDLLPDDFSLACGGGIVPPLAAMPAFRHSLTSLYNTVFEIPKTSFASDITTLKNIYMKPTPGCSADTLALRTALADAGSFGEPPPTEGPAAPNAAQMSFMSNMFPAALMNNPQVQMVTDLIQNAGGEDFAPGCAGLAVTYDIAKDYRQDLGAIDSKLANPYQDDPRYENMYFYFVGSPTAYFSIGSSPLGRTVMQQGPSPALVPGITDNYTGFAERREALATLFADNTFGAYMGAGPLECGTTEPALCAARQSQGWTYNPDNDHWSWPGGIAGGAPADTIDALTLTGHLFGLTDAPPVVDPSEYGAGGTPGVPQNAAALKEAAKAHLYFDAYMSLLNSMAYNVRNSKLFTVEGFSKLALLPIPCQEGGSYGKDLFDINTIINEALEEFADNSCLDRTCSVGPVEDSLIFGITNAYIQILLLEQLLKNIFLIDAYGAAAVVDNPVIIRRILDGIYESITGPGAGDFGTANIAGTGFLHTSLEEAAVVYVDKLRLRAGESSTGEHNLLPDPHDSTQTIEIPVAEVLEIRSEYRKYAFEYLVKRRMVNTLPAFKDIFASNEPNFNTSFIANGLSIVKPNCIPWARALADDGIAMNMNTLDNLIYYRLIDSANEYPAWDYGLNLNDPSQTLSRDEVDYASGIGGGGLFTRQRYVSFDINHANLENLNTSGDLLDNELYQMLNPLFEDLLPGAASAADAANGYSYAAEGTDNIIVSEDKFEAFAERYRSIDPTPIDVFYSRQTVFRRDTELFGEIDATYYFKIHVHPDLIGHPAATNYLPESYPRASSQADGDDTSSGNALMMGVRGPVQRKNYDAIRYWNNMIIMYNTEERMNQELGTNSENLEDEALDEEYITENMTTMVVEKIIDPGLQASLRVKRYPKPVQRRTYNGSEQTFPDGDANLGDKFGYPDLGLHWENLAPYPWWEVTPSGPYNIREEYWALDPARGSQGGEPVINMWDNLKGRVRMEVPKYRPQVGVSEAARANGFFTYRVKKRDLYYSPHNVTMYFGQPHEKILSWIADDSVEYGSLGEEALIRWWHGSASEEEKEKLDLFEDIYMENYPGLGIVSVTKDAIFWDHPLMYPGKGYTRTGGSAGDTKRLLVTSIGDARYSGGPQDLYDQPVGISLSGPGSDTFFSETLGLSLSEYIELIEGPPEEEEEEEGSTPSPYNLSNTEVSTSSDDADPGFVGVGGLEAQQMTEEEMQQQIEDLIYDLPPQGYAESAINMALKSIISNVNIGTRIMYSTPNLLEDSPTFDAIQQTVEGVSMQDQVNEFLSKKANYVMKEPDGFVLNVDTGIRATHQLSVSGMRPFSNRETTIQSLFEKYEAGLITEMADDPQYHLLFNEAFDTEELVAFIFYYGLKKTEDSSAEFNHIFDDTKAALRVILRAALAGDDYAYIDPEQVSPSEAAANAALGIAGAAGGPFVQMGASFILKMLIETPLKILKALAELVDPHVIIGKTIKNVSGQAIQIAEPIWDVAQTAANAGVGAAGGMPDPQSESERLRQEVGAAALEMSLTEFMQAGIDEAFAAGAEGGLPEVPRPLIPSISKKGLDLIGKLPYIFAIPPGPLGLVYILLNLSAADFESLYAVEEGPECYPPEEPPALMPPPTRNSVDDAEESADDSSGTDCDDPPADTAIPASGAGTPSSTGS